MEKQPRSEPEMSVLVLAPTGKDGVLTAEVLSGSGILAVVCSSAADLLRRLSDDTGALLLTEEALTTNGLLDSLAEHVSHQAPWSDLPVLLMTRSGADSPAV